MKVNKMETQLSNVVDSLMQYGKHKGRMYSWAVRHDPGYVAWARTQIPTCGTELFRLVQYADHLVYGSLTLAAFETKWVPLRQRHRAHMQAFKDAVSGPTTNTPAPCGSGFWPTPKVRRGGTRYSFMD